MKFLALNELLEDIFFFKYCRKSFFWQYTLHLISVQKQTMGFNRLNSLLQMSELNQSHSPCALWKQTASRNVLKTVPSPNRAWACDAWLILQHSLKPNLEWYNYICITRILTTAQFLGGKIDKELRHYLLNYFIWKLKFLLILCCFCIGIIIGRLLLQCYCPMQFSKDHLDR